MSLEELRRRIAGRADAIRAARPDWPCRRGCDACCRALARPLAMTAAEWERVDAAVAALSPEVQAHVQARVERLLGVDAGPVTCPYLDEAEGACRIYEARPLACRSYGFYAPDTCAIIDREVGDARVVWGNAASLARDVERVLGPEVTTAVHHRAAITPT